MGGIWLGMMLVTWAQAPSDGAVLIDLGGAVRAADEAPPPPPVLVDKVISIDVVDADIRHVLRLLSELGDINIILDDSVSGTVTMRLIDVAWDDAFRAVLLSKGLGATSIGQVQVVGPAQ